MLPFKVALQGLKKMFCITAQHTIIIAKEQIVVNLFLHNFWFDLPVLLGEFFALGLNGLDAAVHDTGNTTEAHTGHNQPQYKTNNEFGHYSTFT